VLVARASVAREQVASVGWNSAPRGLPSARGALEGALEGTLMSLRAVGCDSGWVRMSHGCVVFRVAAGVESESRLGGDLGATWLLVERCVERKLLYRDAYAWSLERYTREEDWACAIVRRTGRRVDEDYKI